MSQSTAIHVDDVWAKSATGRTIHFDVILPVQDAALALQSAKALVFTSIGEENASVSLLSPSPSPTPESALPKPPEPPEPGGGFWWFWRLGFGGPWSQGPKNPNPPLWTGGCWDWHQAAWPGGAVSQKWTFRGFSQTYPPFGVVRGVMSQPARVGDWRLAVNR